MSQLSHSQRVHIVNKKGLHARASAALAKLAGEYESNVTIHHNDLSASAISIMDLMMLIAHRGAEIEIRGTGADAPQAVTAIASLVASGFGELKDDLPG